MKPKIEPFHNEERSMCNMTIAMGINFGTYVLLAADTRITNYYWNVNVRDYVVKDHADDSVKIQKTSIGLITGAGSVKLLDRVKGRLQKEEVTNTNQFLSIIREERRNYRKLFRKTAEQDIEKTGWILSYYTIDNENLKLRLGMIHPSVGDGLKIMLSENHPWVILPSEATEDYANEFVESLTKEIEPCDQFETLFGSIRHHWLLIARLIRTMHPEFPSISPDCQIGVHTLDGQVGISSILKDTDVSDIDVNALMTWYPP